MAMPAYGAPVWFGTGSESSGATTCTPGLPAGATTGDILIMLVNVGAATGVAAVTAGGDETWELAPDMPLTMGGTANASNPHRMYVFMCRVTAGISTPTVTRSVAGDYIVAQMVGIRSAYSFGNAVDAIDAYEADTVASGSSTVSTLTFLDAEPTVANCAYLFFATTGSDLVSSTHGAITNASVSFLTERIDGGTATAGGGTTYCAVGVEYYSGAFAGGAPSCAPSAGGVQYARYALAIKPPQLDSVAPVIDNISPANASTIDDDASISFRVTDAFGQGFGEISIFARSSTGKGEIVYKAGSFGSLYSNGTNAASATTNGYDFTILRDNSGWYDSGLTIDIVAVDKAGNRSTQTLTYTITGYQYVPPDEAAPTFAVVSPAADSTITPSQALTVDVTEETALRVSILTVSFPSGTEEVVHNGTDFCGLYSLSSRSSIDDGYRYVITRRGGWPGSPTVNHYIVDTSGNRAA